MQYNLKHVYDPGLPRCLNDFLNYLGTIRGKSKNTLNGYKIDLTMFFRFLKLYKGLINGDYEFKKININDIDENFVRHISLSDLFAFISFVENYRNNGDCSRARKVAAIKSFFIYYFCLAVQVFEKEGLLHYNFLPKLWNEAVWIVRHQYLEYQGRYADCNWQGKQGKNYISE